MSVLGGFWCLHGKKCDAFEGLIPHNVNQLPVAITNNAQPMG